MHMDKQTLCKYSLVLTAIFRADHKLTDIPYLSDVSFALERFAAGARKTGSSDSEPEPQILGGLESRPFF